MWDQNNICVSNIVIYKIQNIIILYIVNMQSIVIAWDVQMLTQHNAVIVFRFECDIKILSFDMNNV